LLHLPVNQLDLLFYFLEELGQAALLKNRLSPLQVLLGLLRLRWITNHEQRSNDLISLRHVDRPVTMQRVLQFLQKYKQIDLT